MRENHQTSIIETFSFRHDSAQTSFALPRPIGLGHITGYIWLTSFAQIFAPFHSAKTSDIPKTLYKIPNIP